MTRRLTAILAADVVGYSRLMEADEVGTLAALTAHREHLINPLISQHNGRIVKLMGDGVLVEFDSVVEAVTCALDIQNGMAVANGNVSEDRRIELRIGVHLGDVMVENDDLYGDGVNVAARLEGLADPGGICISQQALDQVETKMDLTYEDRGEQRLKNIARPIHTYCVQPRGHAGRTTTTTRHGTRVIHPLGWAVMVIVVALGAVVGWWQPWKSHLVPASAPDADSPLDEKSSVVVLPFVNISGDKEQEYFSDGMTVDLITDLSKISQLTVISSTTSAGYKGKKIDIREIGKALNVRYAIEGSVRRVGTHVRINVQLVDTTTGGHLWADRYDGDLNEIFSLQDRVLGKVVDSMALKLSEEERRRLGARGTASVAAHDLYLRGLFLESAFTREKNREAMRLYEQALSIDPNYALVYSRMANILEMDARSGWSDDAQADIEKAVELAEKAIAIDPNDPKIYWSLGRATARLGSGWRLHRLPAAVRRLRARDGERCALRDVERAQGPPARPPQSDRSRPQGGWRVDRESHGDHGPLRRRVREHRVR